MIDTLDPQPQRLSLRAGDFFTDTLPTADGYVLMEVIHDWDDDQPAAILTAVRRAAPSGATVLIIEAVAGEQGPDPVVRTLDMIMLAITGGRERTSSQLGQLLAGAGLRPTATLETPGALRIIEAIVE